VSTTCFWHTFWNDVWSDERKLRNVITHNIICASQKERVLCVLLALRTCNVWCNVLFRIRRSIGRHCKRSVNNVIEDTKTSKRSSFYFIGGSFWPRLDTSQFKVVSLCVQWLKWDTLNLHLHVIAISVECVFFMFIKYTYITYCRNV